MRSVLQSALDPAGPQAAQISWLWWLMFWVSTAVFVLVFGLVVTAIVRGGRDRKPDAAGESRLTRAVAIGVALTAVTLFGLLAATMVTHRAILSLGAESALTINVTGHQFWWEIEYDDAVPSRRVTTPNEIHLPVGRPVVLTPLEDQQLAGLLMWVPAGVVYIAGGLYFFAAWLNESGRRVGLRVPGTASSTMTLV